MGTDRLTVAVQGEPGSNSALAAEKHYGRDRVALVPCGSFADLFAAVSGGEAELGVAPVENSLGGSVHQVWDLLARTRCPVIGELYFHVRHCLVAHPSVPLEEIRFVYSHEQALAQCLRFLRRLVWLEPGNIIPAYDTAGAVKMIKARGRREEAAIASARAAEIYAMHTLATDIQTNPDNYTRFLVLAGTGLESRAGSSGFVRGGDRRKEAGTAASPACAPQEQEPVTPAREPGHRHKVTAIFALADSARELPAVLAALRREDLVPVKLETAKLVGQPWQYRIYLDCSTGKAGLRTDRIRSILESAAGPARVLGPYPEAPRPVPRLSPP